MSKIAPQVSGSTLLAILDCPACRAGGGLVPQLHETQRCYLACPSCETWYPIDDNEVIVLLSPSSNPGCLRRPVGPPAPFPLEQRAPREVDTKAVVYAFYATMYDLCERFDLRSAPLVADFGCSTGSFSAMLGRNQTYVGFDISARSLAFARRATGRFYVQADAERLPVKTKAVPFFVSREVLEHLSDPAAGVRELARVGRAGLIQVPTLDFPFLYDPLNYLLVRAGSRIKFGIYGYDHNKLFDRAGWRDLLSSNGFQVERESSIGTGLATNASCIAIHSLFSWREFDSLPRNGVSSRTAGMLFPMYEKLHKADRLLYPFGFSQAYAVSSEAAATASQTTG